MPKRGKHYRAAAEMVESGRLYPLEEAIDLLLRFPKRKFDETVEFHIRLGIDPRRSDQMVRGSVSLPHGIGKSLRVIAFAQGDKADAAQAAGAIEVGAQDLADKIMGGWMDFDVAIADPAMMRHVGKLGKVLGPQGKMPSPKAGTVTPNVADAVREFAAGKIEFRNDNGGNLHAPMGRRSFQKNQLLENVQAFMDYVNSLKPQAAKGHFFRTGTLTATHAPGIPVALD